MGDHSHWSTEDLAKALRAYIAQLPLIDMMTASRDAPSEVLAERSWRSLVDDCAKRMEALAAIEPLIEGAGREATRASVIADDLEALMDRVGDLESWRESRIGTHPSAGKLYDLIKRLEHRVVDLEEAHEALTPSPRCRYCSGRGWTTTASPVNGSHTPPCPACHGLGVLR